MKILNSFVSANKMLSYGRFGGMSVSNHNLNLDQKKIFPFSIIPIRTSLFEQDRRGAEYPFVSKKTVWQHFTDGRKIFIDECKLWVEEVKERLQFDKKIYNVGDTDVFFRFDSEECLKKWRISSDKFNNEGSSECTLIINDKKKAVFEGIVDTTTPKDGKHNFTGFCSIRSRKLRKSFLREDCFHWDPFSHLELRVKGDGRNYAINLGISTTYDVMWFDMFTHPLFTHGGPYWQTVRIPFSKFFLTSKGRIQDKQCPLPKDKVDSVGITCAGVAGPFRLEIDYIGCHYDLNYREKFAYELYKTPKEIVSN